MAKCNFCSKDIPQGTGKMFVLKDGKIINFCSNKCEKFRTKLKKNPAGFKWCKPKEDKKWLKEV